VARRTVARRSSAAREHVIRFQEMPASGPT
jgi:hypothetical protein